MYQVNLGLAKKALDVALTVSLLHNPVTKYQTVRGTQGLTLSKDLQMDHEENDLSETVQR